MYNIDIDLKDLLPPVIEAYSHVFGEEYRSIITERLNKALLLYYVDPKNINDYVQYLERCKARELSIRFLEQIGEDTSKLRKDNFAKSFDIDTQKKLMNIYGDFLGFTSDADTFSPLRAFDSNNKKPKPWLISNMLTIINYLRGKDKDEINENNFEEFTNTDEFKELMKTIYEYKKIYESLLKEYNGWKKDLSELENYITDEKKRKEMLFLKKKKQLYLKVYNFLPEAIRKALDELPFVEQIKLILGENDLGSDSNIEFFLKKNMNISKSLSNTFYKVNIGYQIEYLRGLGVKLPKFLQDVTAESCWEKHVLSKEDIINYFEFIRQEDIKKYIPTSSVITTVIKARKRMYQEAIKEYYETRDDFCDIMNHFGSDPYNKEVNYSTIKDNLICIIGGYDDKGDCISIMFFGMRDPGLLAHDFIHECGHVIEHNEKGIGGFEADKTTTKNPYDGRRREYEVFNETINDIFTMEANQYLQDQGIYLMEPKEVTNLDPSSVNTNNIVKDLLTPLIVKFRKQVIKAKITATPSELTDYIGINNYNELVDAINKVDHLANNGLSATLKADRNHPMVKEFFEQVKRVEQIYFNINEYYQSHFGNISSNNTEEVVKSF